MLKNEFDTIDPRDCIKLWSAVLHRAIQDAINLPGDVARNSKQQVQDEARTWIFSGDKYSNGFESVCFLLDIDHKIVRQKVEERI